MSEFCVSPNADDLESEVEDLNHDLAWEDSGGGRYVVASLYTAPPAPAVPSFDEWLESTGTHPVGWVREVMEESYNACRAAMLAQQQNGPQNIPNIIPDGYKLVPVDPTKDMLRAGQSVVGFWLNTIKCYEAMLAAAPQPK